MAQDKDYSKYLSPRHFLPFENVYILIYCTKLKFNPLYWLNHYIWTDRGVVSVVSAYLVAIKMQRTL